MFKKINFSVISTWMLVGLAFLLPIFFLPLTSEMFDLNKRFLFMGAALVFVFLGAVTVIIKKEVKMTRTPWGVPVFLFGLSAALSMLFVSPNKVQALLGNGGMYVAFAVAFILGSSLIVKSFTGKLIAALSFAGVIVTLASLFDRFGSSIAGILNSSFGLSIPEGTRIFLTGSPLFTVFFLSLVTVMLVVRFLQTRGKSQNVLAIVFAAICVIGIAVNFEALLPGRATHPQFLSWLDSWSIATDVLKTPVNAVLGVGTDSYATAFSLFKPLRLNQSPIWFVRFNNARSSILEFLTTQGVFGLAAWILILLTTLRLIKTSKGDQLPLGVGTLLILGMMLYFPPNVILMGLLCVFLIAWSASLKERGIRTTESTVSLFSYGDFSAVPGLARMQRGQGLVAQGFGVIVVVATLVGVYGLGRAYAAESSFNRSLMAAAKGNGKDTYDFAVNAIVANPYMENYHRAFAITNLSLAQAISQKADLTDTEKQNVLTLIQQAIQQAKIATSLDALNTANWDTLTTVYQALIGAADGAQDWTIASFVEQIKTDPANPQLRFSMGSVYRQLGNDDMAIQLFQQAIQLKPDFANAYYNLADIFKKKGDKQSEIAMLQATLQLIKPEQQGYAQVVSRLDELQKETQPQAAQAPKPTPSPTPSIEKVELSGEAGIAPTNGVPEVPEQ